MKRIVFFFFITGSLFAGVAVTDSTDFSLPMDTLAVHEWDVKTENHSLPKLLLAGALFPGGAQYYTGHNVRGGFLTAFEVMLLADILVGKEQQRKIRQRDGGFFRDSVLYFTRLLLQSSTPENFGEWEAGRLRNIQKLRLENDKKIKEEDLRRSELAWLGGLHLYGLMDGFGIWMNNRGRSYEKKSAGSAMWRAALIPGWGQIYNGEWGRAGLLYMAHIGSWASYFSRQKVVEYYLARVRTARAENLPESEQELLREDLVFFRKKRNQYIWAFFLFHLYSVADAAVDALLSDFDSPLHLTLEPYDRGLQAALALRF